MTLKDCITALETGRHLHICVQDVSGILEHPHFTLDFGHRMHDISFCDEAKRTPAGYALCRQHKERVNALGIRHGRAFCGHCPFGLFEIAYPVVLRGKTVCILYVGNLCSDRKIAIRRLRETAHKTDADSTRLEALLEGCEQGERATFLPVAKLLADFIVSAAERVQFSAENAPHWSVKQALAYAERYFSKDIRITEMAALCNIHPQYFGRLFKQQTGVSFAEYLNDLRMQHAATLLQSGNTVGDTATACGYADLPYFCRVFRKHYGVAPSKYKKA